MSVTVSRKLYVDALERAEKAEAAMTSLYKEVARLRAGLRLVRDLLRGDSKDLSLVFSALDAALRPTSGPNKEDP